MRHADQGFTLLEVLVSIAIMSLVLTAAFQFYKGIQDAHARVTGGVDRNRSAGVLLDRIERELVGSVLVQREDGADPLLHPYLFVARDAALNQEGSDSLRFITQTPTRMPGAERTPGLLMVSYAIDSYGGDTYSLVRVEEPVSQQMAKDIDLSEGQIVAEQLASLRFRFQSEAGAWLNVWDSTGVSALDQLPQAVEMTVQLWDRDAAGELLEGVEHVRNVRLPVRPFRMVPPDPNSQEAQTCESGTSVQECISAFQAEIDTIATDDLQGEIQALVQAIDQPCFNSDGPSVALARLQEILADDLRLDIDEICP